MGVISSKLPEIINDLVDVSSRAIAAELDLEEQKALQLGEMIAQHFCDMYGGCQIYIPVGFVLKLSQRDRQIFAEFNGKNHSELAKKWGCSERTIYGVIRRVRAQGFSPDQIELLP